MRRAGFLLVGLFGGMVPIVQADVVTVVSLLGDSREAFETQWREQGFPFTAATEYDVAMVDDELVIRGRSDDANRAMLREVEVKRPRTAILQWQWRVRRALSGGHSERTKAGDDFAARVFVVFETSLIPSRTRAINYVWAANESVGSVFASPYTSRVAHIVLRSEADGNSPDAWQVERRNVLADYEEFFGKPATKISAVAIMVDTDNTGGQAEAEFSRLILEISPLPVDSDP